MTKGVRRDFPGRDPGSPGGAGTLPGRVPNAPASVEIARSVISDIRNGIDRKDSIKWSKTVLYGALAIHMRGGQVLSTRCGGNGLAGCKQKRLQARESWCVHAQNSMTRSDQMELRRAATRRGHGPRGINWHLRTAAPRREFMRLRYSTVHAPTCAGESAGTVSGF